MSYLRILGTALVLGGSAQLGPAYAEPPQPVVVPVMQKDLADVPGKDTCPPVMVRTGLSR